MKRYFRLKIMGIHNSLNIFLRQEIDRMQKVLVMVKNTLRDLVLAIEGTIIMNEVTNLFNFYAFTHVIDLGFARCIG